MNLPGDQDAGGVEALADELVGVDAEAGFAEAGMRLARAPQPFSLHTSRHLMRLHRKSDDQWRKYLFY